MSRAPRNSPATSRSAIFGEHDWRPTAAPAALRRRAELLTAIRGFFHARGVLEVETPLLSAATASDPHLRNLETAVTGPQGRRTLYMQTSPEFAMKRLLAAGSGSIFQVCKAFRDDEGGRLHNPEFTLLEWYRVGFDHHALMDEVEALLCAVMGGAPAAARRSYREALQAAAGVDFVTADPAQLRACALDHGYHTAGDDGLDDPAVYLDFLMGCVVAPTLGAATPEFIYDFPADQAAMARIRRDPVPVAERFELFLRGIELANGYHELIDAAEQRSRMTTEAERRRRRGEIAARPDERLLAAMAHGLPPCAGVALGVDRLLLLMLGGAHLDEVLAFPVRLA